MLKVQDLLNLHALNPSTRRRITVRAKVPLKLMEYGFGFTMIRSPNTPYSIDFRCTVTSKRCHSRIGEAGKLHTNRTPSWSNMNCLGFRGLGFKVWGLGNLTSEGG